MNTPTLKKWGTLFAIREALHDAPMGIPPANGTDPRLEVDRVETSAWEHPRKPECLVSTSLFSLSPHVPEVLGWEVSAEDIQKVLPGAPQKYYWPLRQRAMDYPPGVLHRCYLAQNLAGFIPWLTTSCGFHEVYLMKSAQPGWAGMLWRYLPLFEEQFAQVLCTGVDGYPGNLHGSLCQPTDVLSAVIYPNRWFLPFAGPLRTCTRHFAQSFQTDLPRTLTTFLDWLENSSSMYLPAVSQRALDHTHRYPKILDACFLSLWLWNSRLLDMRSPRPRFFSQGNFEFGDHCTLSLLGREL